MLTTTADRQGGGFDHSGPRQGKPTGRRIWGGNRLGQESQTDNTGPTLRSYDTLWLHPSLFAPCCGVVLFAQSLCHVRLAAAFHGANLGATRSGLVDLATTAKSLVVRLAHPLRVVGAIAALNRTAARSVLEPCVAIFPHLVIVCRTEPQGIDRLAAARDQALLGTLFGQKHRRARSPPPLVVHAAEAFGATLAITAFDLADVHGVWLFLNRTISLHPIVMILAKAVDIVAALTTFDLANGLLLIGHDGRFTPLSGQFVSRIIQIAGPCQDAWIVWKSPTKGGVSPPATENVWQ
ncbi:MAG: hypothetical protein GTO62_13335 [Planctomycetales bacterium]|nr:hypothetical protein [Planctomycetales bacterium]NIP70220.1 hypothetical protein [Planctomycetales bacterium]